MAPDHVTRRAVLQGGGAAMALPGVAGAETGAMPPVSNRERDMSTVELSVNGRRVAGASAADRHEEGVRSWPMRRLHRDRGGPADQQLPDVGCHA